MLIKIFVKVIAIFFSIISFCFAELPNSKAIIGLDLGISPDRALELLSAKYPTCEIGKKYIKNKQTSEFTDVLSSYELDVFKEGATKLNCLPGSDVHDSLSLSFLNLNLDKLQPLYNISLSRLFPSPLNNNNEIQYTFDDVKNSLFEKYGKPSEELRDKSFSQIPHKIINNKKGKGKYVTEEEIVVNYIWGLKGQTPNVGGICFENCGEYYLHATIIIVKLSNLTPKNTFYVQSLTLYMVDDVLDKKQMSDSYDALMNAKKKNIDF